MKKLWITVLAASLVGCAGIDTQIAESDKTRSLITDPAARPDFAPVTSRPRAVVRTPMEVAKSQPVTGTVTGVPLHTVLEMTAPNFIAIPSDKDVDMAKEVDFSVKALPLSDFLDVLGVITDYHFEPKGKKILVSSRVTKRWNLAALSTARAAISKVGTQGNDDEQGGGNSGAQNNDSGGSGALQIGGGSSTDAGSRGTKMTVRNNHDEWDNTFKAVSQIVGANDAMQLRGLGLIQASGTPSEIAQIDSWMNAVQEESTRQVHLSVHAYDVTLDDSKGSGINWSALINGTFEDTGTVALGLSGASPLDVTNEGIFGGTLGLTQDDDTFSSMLNFLGQYGEVEVITQPQLTVTNGVTALISNGDEFSYVSQVSTALGGDGVAVVTPEFERLLVGVGMSVTPRILDDGRVLVNVVPVISTLTRFDSLSTGTVSTSQPNIALQELATQVITRSGQPIQIGGLISSRVSSALNRLPSRDRESAGLLGWLFRSDRNEISRRELVITITPTIVGA